MIRKYRYGAPFDTEAVTVKIETANGAFPYGKISLEKGFDFTYAVSYTHLDVYKRQFQRRQYHPRVCFAGQ